MHFSVNSFILAITVSGAATCAAQSDNLNHLPPDLTVPKPVQGDAAAGTRVAAVTPGWEGTDVRHVLYLPRDWLPGKSYPVLVEYPGNGGYRNDVGDVSDGSPESCMLGYGLTGGSGFLWVCLPFIETSAGGAKGNCRQWWGDVEETRKYCIASVRDVCKRYGGDASKVVLCGFSRGAIACNFIGLRDDGIASLWCGFFCHSHYDGVRPWPYAGSDPAAAMERLRRLAGRPQWISHELDVGPARQFIEASGERGAFEFVPIPYPNHSASWVLRDIPERAKARDWLRRTVGPRVSETR